MVTILVPLLVAVIGGVVYLVAANPKAQELGRITFAVGMLVTVWLLAGRVVNIP